MSPSDAASWNYPILTNFFLFLPIVSRLIEEAGVEWGKGEGIVIFLAVVLFSLRLLFLLLVLVVSSFSSLFQNTRRATNYVSILTTTNASDNRGAINDRMVARLLRLLVIRALRQGIKGLVRASRVRATVGPLRRFSSNLNVLRAIIRSLRCSMLRARTTLVERVMILRGLCRLFCARSTFDERRFYAF